VGDARLPSASAGPSTSGSLSMFRQCSSTVPGSTRSFSTHWRLASRPIGESRSPIDLP
jgi:hypothetical protein